MESVQTLQVSLLRERAKMERWHYFGDSKNVPSKLRCEKNKTPSGPKRGMQGKRYIDA